MQESNFYLFMLLIYIFVFFHIARKNLHVLLHKFNIQYAHNIEKKTMNDTSIIYDFVNVFIKPVCWFAYTGCSLNIVFFRRFQNIFRTLASLGFPSVRVCTQ